jgi:predicted dehydrogenase
MSTSYIQSPLAFKIRKVLRYTQLYGPSKTLAKVRGQWHMAREDGFAGARWVNPQCRNPDHPSRMVGIIGCGNFAYSMIAYALRRETRNFLRATYDILPSRAKSLCRDYGGYYASASADALIADEKIKLVYIASNHASHAEYAIACLDAGKSVHIDKPQVVSEDQLTRLLDAQARNPNAHVFLGFNRPRSEHFRRICAAFAEQRGPIMLNWFIAGHEIPEDHWYFSEAEGGRVLGNLCHWTDLTLELVGLANAFPCKIMTACPPDAKSDFCVGITFRDGSVAGITFSAKGHTFEGVREVMNAHRGDALVSLVDFQESKIEVGADSRKLKSWQRDHGHTANILNSLEATLSGDATRATDVRYNKATARLFLGVKKAIDEGHSVEVSLDP